MATWEEHERKTRFERCTISFKEEVNPMQLLPYLECFTESTKEQIERWVDRYGAEDAAWRISRELVKMDDWYEDIIHALRETNHDALADRICGIDRHEGGRGIGGGGGPDGGGGGRDNGRGGIDIRGGRDNDRGGRDNGRDGRGGWDGGRGEEGRGRGKVGRDDVEERERSERGGHKANIDGRLNDNFACMEGVMDDEESEDRQPPPLDGSDTDTPVSAFATDFQAERRDRQAYEKRWNDAVAELKQRDNVIQMLQEQLQRQQESSSGYSRQTSTSTRQYIPYNQQSCGQQMIARGGSGQPRYYGQDMPDLPTDDVELKQRDNVIQMLQRQVSVFATDFQAELRDRQAYEKRCNDAVAELKQRDNVIQMLQEQLSTFATDFQVERRDRQAYEKRCNDAVAELKQRDNVIQMLQEQLQRQQESSSGYLRQTSTSTRQYIQYNQQSCGQQMIARGGSGQPRYYGQDMPDLPTDDVETDGHRGFDEPDIGPRVLRGEEDVDYQGIQNIRLAVGTSSLSSVTGTGDHSAIVLDDRASSLPSTGDSNRMVLSAAQNMGTCEQYGQWPIFDILNQETYYGMAPMQSLQPSSAECLYNESPPCSMPQQEELNIAVGGACCIGGESQTAHRLLPICPPGNHHMSTNHDDPEMGQVVSAYDYEHVDLCLELEETRKIAEDERKRAEAERKRAEEERKEKEEMRRELEELRLLMRMSLQKQR